MPSNDENDFRNWVKGFLSKNELEDTRERLTDHISQIVNQFVDKKEHTKNGGLYGLICMG